MTPSRSRFVTACQQLLALAVVLAVLTPAASLVTLDVVGSGPDGPGRRDRAVAPLSAHRGVHRRGRPPVQGADGAGQARRPRGAADLGRAGGRPRRAHHLGRPGRRQPGGVSRLTTTPQPVTGFGEVGVTWAHGVAIPQPVRSRSRPAPAPTAPGPPWRTDPLRPGARPRPGLGRGPARPARHRPVARRQGRPASRCARVSTRPLPADMKLAVISPGPRDAHRDRARRPRHQHDGRRQRRRLRLPRASTRSRSTGDSAQLAAAVFTPRPVIYSRAQWGADEKMRSKSSLHYGDVHAGLRAPHRQRQRLHAGRGAGAPPQHLRLPRAVPRLERHRLQLPHRPLRPDLGGPVRRHRPRRRRCPHPRLQRRLLRRLGDRQLRAGQAEPGDCSRRTAPCSPGSSRCTASTRRPPASTSPPAGSRRSTATATPRPPPAPGSTSTTSSPPIRRMAAADQRGWSGRQLESNLASTPTPDIVVRRASDGEAFVVPTGGLIHFPAPTIGRHRASPARPASWSPRDLTGDHRSDLLVRQADGSLAVRPGTASGTFAATRRRCSRPSAARTRCRPRATSTATGVPTSPPATRPRVRSCCTSRSPNGTFRHVARRQRSWNSYDLISAAGDLTATACPTWWPATGRAPSGCSPATGHAGFAPRGRGSPGTSAPTP